MGQCDGVEGEMLSTDSYFENPPMLRSFIDLRTVSRASLVDGSNYDCTFVR